MRDKADKEAQDAALKITNQARAKGGMEYDLKFAGSRITLLIVPRSNDGDLGEWRVEARASRAADATVVTEWGATRLEALRAVGRAWTSKRQLHGLPHFDWESVVQVLNEVRAL